MGYAATMDVRHIPLLVWDQDNTKASRELVSHITSTYYFDHAGSCFGYDQVERALKRDRAKAALVIPPGFQERLGRGRTATVQAVIDGSDSNQALILQNYLSIIVQQQSADVVARRLSSLVSSRAPSSPGPMHSTRTLSRAASPPRAREDEPGLGLEPGADGSAAAGVESGRAASFSPSSLAPGPAGAGEQATPGPSAAVLGLAASIARMQEEGSLAVSPQPRVWYNPELRSANFMVPGVVVMVLLVITMMLTALAVVREKEVGTMEQVIVTPIKPWQFILGKLSPFVIIGFMEVTLVVLVAVLWFKVPFRGSMAGLYGYASLFLLTTLGGGLFLSTISNNQQQAMMAAFFIMFTMILLSGFMFPIENMPRPVQVFTYLIPMRYFLVIVRSLFLKGSGLVMLWDQALGLLVLGLAVIVLSVRRFGKTLD